MMREYVIDIWVALRAYFWRSVVDLLVGAALTIIATGWLPFLLYLTGATDGDMLIGALIASPFLSLLIWVAVIHVQMAGRELRDREQDQ